MALPRGSLETDRLMLRLADPDNTEDCEKIISVYHDKTGSQGGNARVGINTVADVRMKHKIQGPRQELCTLTPAPREIFHLIFLKQPQSTSERAEVDEFVGMIAMNFRPEMPYPDLGYALLAAYEGKGYASEAGRAVLDWWREVVGIKEVFIATMAHNVRSQKTAERIGFVRGGLFEVGFGTGSDLKVVEAESLILPGMVWQEFDADGKRRRIYPTVGVEIEQQRNDALSVR